MTISNYTFYDNTRLSAFRFCPRYFYFRHVRHWAVQSTAIWFTFGGAWHAAMDVMWRVAPTAKSQREAVEASYTAFVEEWCKRGEVHPSKMGMDEIEDYTPRTPMIAKEMLAGYYRARERMFKSSTYILLAVEQPFAVPLDPNDPSLQYVGRLDKVFEYDARIRIGEHKTTTAYKKDGFFRSEFLNSFSPSSQIDGYQYSGNLLYNNQISSIWVDAALVHKTEHNGFKLITLDRHENLLDMWLWETHDWIAQIEMNKAALLEHERVKGKYMAAFPRNTKSCGDCEFRDVCNAKPNPHTFEGVPLGFEYRPWSPFDEIALERIGFTREQDAAAGGQAL